MNIYEFQNMLYSEYLIKNRFNRETNTLIHEISLTHSNVLKRAVGEEFSDFLRYNKNIIIIPYYK